ncbi:MAG: hypothetical protein GX297_03885 [Treponema sp.]|nr:hypothetical protein [Treponema sp.]
MQVIFTIFQVFSLVVTMYDIKRGAIPRWYFIAYEILFLIILLIFNIRMILPALLRGVYALGLFSAARQLHKKKMGKADIWYAVVSAETLPFMNWHISMLIGCVLALIYMIVAKTKVLPFLPFMSLGCAITIWFFLK